jgi:deoxyribonuclease (pyrimidine dimer)
MTRINVGIMPEELPSKLLLAEHREIKRIPNMITSGKARVSNIPEKFTLGTGHVKFFYDKQCYLHLRYIDLYLECVNRDFQVQDYSSAWGTVPRYLFNDWTPSDHDRQIIIDRIESKGFKLLCPSFQT